MKRDEETGKGNSMTKRKNGQKPRASNLARREPTTRAMKIGMTSEKKGGKVSRKNRTKRRASPG